MVPSPTPRWSPPSSPRRRRRAAVVTPTRSGGSSSKDSLGVGAARDISSDDNGGGNDRSEEKAAAAVTSSRRGPKYSPPKPVLTEEERKAKLRAFVERKRESAREYYPTFLDNQAKEPARLAIEYFKNKEGVLLQLEKMIHASTELTSVGFVTHLQFNAMPLSPGGPPTTVYAQIHKRGPFPREKNPHAHASRVFTRESPLLEDPLFKFQPDGWLEYPYDCPECGLDFNADRESFKVLRRSKLI